MTGVTPSGSGLRPSGAEPQDASQAEPLVPNAGSILWCVHVIGPDDVHAAPDFDTAEKWAVGGNRLLREYTKAAGVENDPYWPETRNVVAVWPWSAEAHAEDVPRSVREFTPINILKAEDLERGAREIEGDSDNPLRVAKANEMYAEAAELRAQYASAIEGFAQDAEERLDPKGESAAPIGETPRG